MENIVIKKLKPALLFAFILSGVMAKAQYLTLTFKDSLEVLKVMPVTATNLRTGESATFSNNEVLLRDVTSTGLSSKPQLNTNMMAYPNPFNGKTNIYFFSEGEEAIELILTNSIGQVLASSREQIEAGYNTFDISSNQTGINILQIISSEKSESMVLINNQSETKNEIRFSACNKSNNLKATSGNRIKGLQVLCLDYLPGDRIKFDVTAETAYRSILTDIPTVNKEYLVSFYDCTDGDGNNYKTVRIGKQVWMAENLRTTKNSKGDPIPKVTLNASWTGLSTKAYCWMDNDSTTNSATYGALYNWFTVEDEFLCPTGWKVPADEDWDTLETYLGGSSVAGGKLKEVGASWHANNVGATNASGFSALPGSMRGGNGWFNVQNFTNGWWWSSTASDATYAWYRNLYYDTAISTRSNSYDKKSGISVRCIKQ